MKSQYSTNMVGGFILQHEKVFWPHVRFKGNQTVADEGLITSLTKVAGGSVNWDHSYPDHLGQALNKMK